MQVSVLPVTAYAKNCSILACPSNGAAAIVDPGGALPRTVA
jgi:hypothetical protein